MSPFEAASSASSLRPSDSISQAPSSLSEPDLSPCQHPVKRRKLRAVSTWDHFREAEGDEPHMKAGKARQTEEREKNALRAVINADAFREAQMLMAVRRHLPLNFVTWPKYQALLSAINPAVEEFLVGSGGTVAADLDTAHAAHQQSIKRWLLSARSLIHISMDVWSSPQRKSFIAVHAQWVDESYLPRKALLGLPNLRRSHAGAAMVPHLMNVIQKFELANSLGYFTGDNDTKNDTCLRQLAKDLLREYGVVFDPVASRTRCFGHIINLSLQAFLFASSKRALEAAIEEAQDEANDATIAGALQDRIHSSSAHPRSRSKPKGRADAAGWRRVGPLGKLHNIAVFIRNSTIHNDAWDDVAGKALGLDNITRWNSWFKLLDAAIRQEGSMSIFLNQFHRELEDDILTHDDWQILKMTHEFLQPFHQATMEQQMEWASIDQVLENMDILFKQFEDAKIKYADNERMVNSIHMGWWVLAKYYEESDSNPIYVTALLLHPEKRRRYIDRHWPEEWREGPVAAARQLWAKYKTRSLTATVALQPRKERLEMSPYERIKQSMSVLDEPVDEDEFEKFINSPPRQVTAKTPLEWWCREEQRMEYPRLHQMAIDILSVPAMSVGQNPLQGLDLSGRAPL
ncbi:transposase-like protein [Metarhizium robertsii ARSEF 23]|uniref:Transposase-like protein n=1 Tax=Metarhizium robertsii (strain ARSEF 23 / ATCC MYA-3075) TaxID=655844 RepID=E9EMU3_METRA|nr:transposase-like protein [Metarhizium robertsii ARSEF 23]EFZ03287.1 transposase-like protein [Metarhizium robertsii ARSEF 23]